MKTLVTGAAGFIGSHLCERLIADGHKVIGFDDLSNGKIENLNAVMAHSNFLFRRGDITDPILHMSMKEIDWVFHLAAKADLIPSMEKPIAYHNANVTGTMCVMESARLHNVKRVIYAASSSCYGIPANYPTSESEKIDLQHPYALTKYLGEQYVLHWAKAFKLPAMSLRLFNVYGPRHRTSGAYGGVFGTWMAQLANGKPVTVVGDGEQTRDFTYVTDVCDAFIKAAESQYVGIALNVGSDRTVTVNWLATLLAAPERVQIPDRPREPRCTFADIEMAKELLGWHPKVQFEDGVRIMKDFIPEYKDAPVWDPESIATATKPWFENAQ